MNRSIMSCTIYTPSPGVFALESTGELIHSSDMLADKIESLIAQVGAAKITAVVLDTTAAMTQARLALSAKHPAITFLRSCADTMSAMVHDMLVVPSVASTLATCKQLTRFIA